MSISVANTDDVTSSFSWREWTTRLHAYISWLNSQLKKQEGSRLISDLRNDLQDGVVIAQLVEALGGDPVVGVDTNPTTPATRKDNVERIFQYFSSKQVPISNCRAKDVLAGDLKCIMRLIHAVASHYRPESVLNPPASDVSSIKTGNCSPSRCASSLAHIGQRNHSKINSNSILNSSSSSSLLGRSRPAIRAFSPLRKVDELSSLPIRKQPVSVQDTSKASRSLSPVSSAVDQRRCLPRKSVNSVSNNSKLSEDSSSNCNNKTVTKDLNNRISCKVAPLQRPMRGTAPLLHARSYKKKNLVSRSEPCFLNADDYDKKIIAEKKVQQCLCESPIDKYYVDQLLNDVKEAKEMLFHLRKLLLHGNSGKVLDETEQGVPYGCSDEQGTLSPHAKGVCEERKGDKTNYKFKSRSEQKDSNNARNLTEENDNLRKVMEDKDLEIKRLKIALDSCSANSDKKIKYPYLLTTRTQREELQVVHEALSSLRKCFPANDPHQHTLDTIEQSLSALLERLNSMEIGATKPDAVLGVVSRTHYETNNDSIQDLTPKMTGFSVQSTVKEDATKVVYYMDKSATPFRSLLNKRIGDATLRDFKLLFDRPGQYRYHFKTLDPEFGMVKEEVLQDEDILPSWDGKIIAWIEEECS